MNTHGFDAPQFHDSIDDIVPSCVTPILVGHKKSVQFMLAAAGSGHHALILDGERGIGKATAAFHLANLMLSGADLEAQTELPAPETTSETYRQIAQNVHPNMLYLTRPLKDDGKGFKTVITINEIRRLQRFLGMTASGGIRRIVIVDSLGDMNRSASNAILKMLEEPPSNTLFLLISHGSGGLLPTIRSRCQMVRFSPLSEKEVSHAIMNIAAHAISEQELPETAAIAHGSVRNGLEMARSGGVELQKTLNGFLQSPHFDTATAHKLADVAGMRGSDIHNSLLRDMIYDAVQNRALEASKAGEHYAANRFSNYCANFAERTQIADGYNLDRRQEFLVIAGQLHSLFHDA